MKARNIRRRDLLKGIPVLLVAVFAALAVAAQPASSVLLHDDFDGPLSPVWTVKQPAARTEGGWVYLHSPGGAWPRDAWIVTGEGNDWADYRFSTYFSALGPYDWYFGEILFRVSDFHSVINGLFYRVEVQTPLRGRDVYLWRVVGGQYRELIRTQPAPGVIENTDNKVDIDVIGGRIRCWINHHPVFDIVDSDPILSGGVGLGSIWESTARYDYVHVDAVGAPFEKFDIAGMNVLFAGGAANFDSYSFAGRFVLDATSDGIDPLQEDVNLRVGTSELTIPSGSFALTGNTYAFTGVIDGASVSALILDRGARTYEYAFKVAAVDMRGNATPVKVALKIGNEDGESTEELRGRLSKEGRLVIEGAPRLAEPVPVPRLR